jgi:hypothetical protein
MCPIVFKLFLLQYCPSLLIGNVVEVEEIGVIVWYPHCVHELRGALNSRLFWDVDIKYSALRHGEKDARKKSRLLYGSCGDMGCRASECSEIVIWMGGRGIGCRRFSCFRMADPLGQRRGVSEILMNYGIQTSLIRS